ncbi:hypothetical protein CL622_04725 [archaeon]|nr:hypothetical protein [archaeon]|tara:strand:+ start:404 stop:4408 length:4005 start_codon:yes stop_codon:yes gene_type:complete
MIKKRFVILSTILCLLLLPTVLAPTDKISVFDKLEEAKQGNQVGNQDQTTNRKNPQFYPKGKYIAFAVSDQKWEDVVTWNSATVWSKPDLEESKEEKVGSKPIFPWDPNNNIFGSTPVIQIFSVTKPIIVETLSFHYKEPKDFTNKVILDIVEVGNEEEQIIKTFFEGKGNAFDSPLQPKAINLAKPYTQLQPGTYKLRIYTDGGKPEYGFKYTGELDQSGNPKEGEATMLYRIIEDKDNFIEEIVEEPKEIDVGPCNELVFDNEGVYSKPVNVCAHPLAFYHEETFLSNNGIRPIEISDIEKRSPVISGDNLLFRETNSGSGSFELNIYYLNLKTGKKVLISPDSKFAFNPSVSDDNALWEESNDPGESKVILHNLKTGVKEVLDMVPQKSSTSFIAGDFVVWDVERFDLDPATIGILSLEDRGIEYITFPPNIEIRFLKGKNNKLFWAEISDKDPDNYRLYMYDLLTKKKTLIMDDAKDWLRGHGISEEIIVKYRTIQNVQGIYVYDIATKTTRLLLNAKSFDLTLDVDEGKIVWNMEKDDDYIINLYDPAKDKEIIKRKFDADAGIYLLQQYQPDKLYTIGSLPDKLSQVIDSPAPLGPDLRGKVTVLDPVKDYLKLWEYYGTIIYVEHKYDIALVAASYASLLNAPLIIAGSPLDIAGTFRGKNVICVGNIDPKHVDCSKTYDLFSLQKKYIEETDTNRFILVNPDDWHIKQKEEYKPDKSQGDIISELYTKASLTSPRLAGLKEEGLLIVYSKTIDEIDKDFTETIQRLRPDLTLKRHTCSPGQTCAQGFREITRFAKNYGNKITYSFDPPEEDILINEIDNFFFNVFLTDCNGIKEIELYNNGMLIGVTSGKCIVNPVPESRPGAILVSNAQLKSSLNPNQQGKFIEKGELTLTLKGDGTMLVPGNFGNYRDDDVKMIYRVTQDDYDFFTCRNCIIESKSDKKKNFEIKRIGTDLEEISFSFSDLDTTKDYILDLKVRGGISREKLDWDGEIYVNGNLIAGKLVDKQLLEIPRQLITNPIKIKIKTDGVSDVIYTVDASLRASFNEQTYLTILASPNTFPIARETNECITDNNQNKAQEVDNRFYGDVDGNFLPDFITTRIFSISVADISAMIDRTAFMGLNKDHKLLAVMAGVDSRDSPKDMEEKFNSFWSPPLNNLMGEKWIHTGYDEIEANKDNIGPLYDDASLIYYYDHGTINELSLLMSTEQLIAEKIYLNNPLILTVGCSTCAWDKAIKQFRTNDLFCSQNIRRGSLGMYLATDDSHWNTPFKTLTDGIFLDGKSIGKAVQEGKYHQYYAQGYNFCEYDQDPFYVWIGDGTLSLKDKGEVRK